MLIRICGSLALLLPVLVMAAESPPKPGEHIQECRNCPEQIVLSAGP